MAIIATLIILFLLFFLTHRHSGQAHLAMIAGLSVYEMFGTQFAGWIHQIAPNIPLDVLKTIIYLALILAFPLLMYFRAGHGGLGGIFRVIEAAMFAVIMTALLSPILAKYLPFDDISVKISSFITTIEGPIVLAGIIFAYVDILFTRKKS